MLLSSLNKVCISSSFLARCITINISFLLQIINLEKPYATNCTKRSLAVFNSNSYTAYTKAACLLNCRNEYTIETCGCTPLEFKGLKGMNRPSHPNRTSHK